MVRPGQTRHGPNNRVLAHFLIVAQFLLFTAHVLAHLHATLPCSANHATITPRGLTLSAGPTHQQVLRAVPQSAAECPICRVAQSTVTATVMAPGIAFLATLCGDAPAHSTFLTPRLSLGPSSARAPP